MKRIIMICLALLIALMPISATAAPGDAILGGRDAEGRSNEYFSTMFVDGDTLYLAGNENFQAYHIGDEETTKYVWDIVDPDEAAASDEGKSYNHQYVPFACDDKLYTFDLISTYQNDSSAFSKAVLYELALTEDGKAQGTMLREVDWSAMVQSYDNYSYASTPSGCVAFDNVAYMLVGTDSGENEMRAIDLETGVCKRLDIDKVLNFTSYKDNSLLIQQYDYARPSTVSFMVYDGATATPSLLSEVEIEEYSTFEGLAYDAESDTAYCVNGGEICPLDLMTGEVGEGVNDMPLDNYGNAAMVMDGGYYVYQASAAAIRNLDPAQKATHKLKIFDSSYVDFVYDVSNKFSNSHGDVSLVISRDYSEMQGLIENMMNRDSSVDIYIIRTDTKQYEALYNRGYMMELSDNEKIKALVDRIYPTIVEKLTFNGEIVAVPAHAYMWTFGINEKALGKLGLTIEDVPTNWSDLLDFMIELPQHFTEDCGVTFYYSGMTDQDMRSQLLYQIIESYGVYLDYAGQEIGYNTPLLRSLLEKLLEIDFIALGLEPAEEQEDEQGGSRIVTYSGGGSEDNQQLIEMSMGASFGNFHTGNTPIVLSMDKDTPAIMTLDASVAFINPFSENRELAIEFMEMMVDGMPDSLLYNFDPAMNTPLRDSYYETQKEEYDKNIKWITEAYEKAEEADKQSFEQQLKEMEEYKQYYEENSWTASQSQIDWFRANDEYITTKPMNWMYDSEAGGEARSLIEQYVAKQIDVNQLLMGIDQKVQMMVLEGN